MTEIQGENLLGEIKYICLNSDSKKELIEDFDYEFKAEYDELGRKPNQRDLEEYFGMKITIDESIDEDQKYVLLKRVR